MRRDEAVDLLNAMAAEYRAAIERYASNEFWYGKRAVTETTAKVEALELAIGDMCAVLMEES